MGKDASLHKVFGVDLAVFSAANDVVETHRDGTDQLPCAGHEGPEQRRDAIVAQERSALDQEQRVDEREKPVAVMEKEIADGDHHLTAMMPQKLYHLKKTSQ